MNPLEATVPGDFTTTRERLENALSEQGFGVLTEVDLQATFERKLGVDHEPHVILGVCNPAFAKQALDVDRDVALLLPCTVTLRWTGNATEVRILDPEQAFKLASEDAQSELAGLAGDVRARLAKALQSARS